MPVTLKFMKRNNAVVVLSAVVCSVCSATQMALILVREHDGVLALAL
jgi:hypothetical protein